MGPIPMTNDARKLMNKIEHTLEDVWLGHEAVAYIEHGDRILEVLRQNGKIEFTADDGGVQTADYEDAPDVALEMLMR